LFFFKELIVKSADGSALLSWPVIENATEYEVQIRKQNISAPDIYRTTTTWFFVKNLTNQQNYTAQVHAKNNDTTINKSLTLPLKPRSFLSVFNFSAIPKGDAGKITLTWTYLPIDVSYQIERCDIGHANKYINVKSIADKNLSSYVDETPCDPTKLVCAGHYYKLSSSDAPWLPTGSITTSKILCMRKLKPKTDSSALSSNTDTSTTSLPVTSVSHI